MIVKIILDKKVIEEEEDSLPYIWKSDLITHSKEVEIVELIDGITEFLMDEKKYSSYNQFLNENGYKLIKIKQ